MDLKRSWHFGDQESHHKKSRGSGQEKGGVEKDEEGEKSEDEGKRELILKSNGGHSRGGFIRETSPVYCCQNQMAH